MRWHRDKYKQVILNYDTPQELLAKLIKERTKIAELEQILAIMGTSILTITGKKGRNI